MKIYLLTSVGNSIAANPNNGNSIGYRVLAYLRRHGNQSSDLQLIDHLQISGAELNAVMKNLEDNQAVRCVVRT